MDINQQVAIENAVMRIVCGDSRSYGGRNDIYRNRCFLCGMFHIEDTDRKLSFCFSFYDDCSLLLFFRWPILDCYRNSDFYPFRRT